MRNALLNGSRDVFAAFIPSRTIMGRTIIYLAIICLATICLTIRSAPTLAADSVLSFETEEQAALYLELTKSHRCLKCQNQNLADSNAGIAQDLKREIYERVVRGETGPEISNYLVTRYGDFVRYKPVFKPTTYILWIGPFLLLIAAVLYALRISRHNIKQQNHPDNDTLARARELLDE